jgi:hypothetical protein
LVTAFPAEIGAPAFGVFTDGKSTISLTRAHIGFMEHPLRQKRPFPSSQLLTRHAICTGFSIRFDTEGPRILLTVPMLNEPPTCTS